MHGKCEKGVGVDQVHLGRLGGPVGFVVLDDAKHVDPEILCLDAPAKGDSIADRLRQRQQLDGGGVGV